MARLSLGVVVVVIQCADQHLSSTT